MRDLGWPEELVNCYYSPTFTLTAAQESSSKPKRNASTSLRQRVSKFTEAKCCLTAAKEARLRVLRVC